MTLHACTIVARNYLPHARVVSQSFLEQHPGARFTTLLIDDRDRSAEGEPFEVLHLDELIPDEGELHLLAAYYDVMELATAVKPLLLMKLLAESGGEVIYLDPDIYVFAQLTPVIDGLALAPIALTPHTTLPIPRDGLRPTEAEIMGSGIYNLGFIGVREGAEPFLRWWWERLQRDAVVDPARMLFTDQRWIDFVPGLYEHTLLKDPGLNVAYWNLHARKVECTESGWEADGEPLRFFHFSGYSPFRPDVLSKHTGDHPRVRLQDSAELTRLTQLYGSRLLEEGLSDGRSPGYGWDTAGHVRLDAAMRRAYRSGVLASEARGGPPPPNPFSAEGGAARFVEWLLQPTPGRSWTGVNRYLYALYDMRADLQRHFPESDRSSAKEFREWAASGGVPQLAEIEQTFGSDHFDALPAVRVLGYLRAELGMGEHGRQLVEALAAAGVEVSTTTWTETISRQEHDFEDRTSATEPLVDLLVVNADQIPVLASVDGATFFDERYTIAAWAWELDEFPPEFDQSIELVDEIWANSDFARDAICRRTDKPVLSVPPPVTRAVVPPNTTRSDLGLPEGFLFLFAFDHLSVLQRKNPLGLIEAFSRAFAPGEGPTLVIKSINGDRLPRDRARVQTAVGGRDDIILLDGYLTPAKRSALMALADCYVSLHRSEGFGLTMAESMALGKPVIATGYSGNLTFMNEANSFLVPFELTAVGEGAEPYSPTAMWAEPDVEVAAELMREVWLQPERARAVGSKAAADIAACHSPAARARVIKERLEALTPLLGTSGRARGPAPASLGLGPLQRRVQRTRFLVHVATTPELRRAAIRRRVGATVSAGFGQSRRAVAEQEAARTELATLRKTVDLLARSVDELQRASLRAQSTPPAGDEGTLAGLRAHLSLLERRIAELESSQRPEHKNAKVAPTHGPAKRPPRKVPADPSPGISSSVPEPTAE
jgi:glycosyltransferase involved in cell wall biosynthesis